MKCDARACYYQLGYNLRDEIVQMVFDRINLDLNLEQIDVMIK